MSIEVQVNKYQFLPDAPPPLNLPSKGKKNGQQNVVPQQRLQFIHNYLHDVEGLFWIAAWLLFYTYPASRLLDASNLKRVKEQLETAERIFPGTLHGSTHRTSFLWFSQSFTDDTQCLPEEYTFLKSVVSHVRYNLTKLYKAMEDPLSNAFDKKLFGCVYDVLSSTFLQAQEHAEGNVISLSDAIQKMEEKAKEEEAREKAAIARDDQGDDQFTHDGVEGDGRRDMVPNTTCKRPRDGQQEEFVFPKKRKH